MLDEIGYICILRGIDDVKRLPQLREEAVAERALVRLSLDNESIPDHELFDNPFKILQKLDRPWQPTLNKRGEIAVVLHLFYTELWPEFELFLTQMQRHFDLWITHCSLGNQIQKQILEAFPHARIIEVENRGRDIWPFISLLNAGSLGRYDYICKIHSKKSAHGRGNGEGMLGLRWRRRALYDLLAFGCAESILDMFECDPRLGIVGPKGLRMPNALVNPDVAWGSIKNQDNVRQLALRMGLKMSNEELDFFAGSMFWVRSSALEPIKRLRLKRADFPDENGQIDGELQHALERLFSVSARNAGFKIAEMSHDR